MQNRTPQQTTLHNYHSVWLSDIHLGSRDCKAEFLCQFLENLRCKHLFLVGDVVDLWALKRRSFWPESHQRALKLLSRMARRGTEVVYITGNHDEAMRDFAELEIFGLTIKNEYVYQTRADKKLLMLHGDLFDSAVYCGRFHSWIGDRGYDLLMWMNRWYNRLRKSFGFSYFSLAGYIKAKVKDANAAVERFKHAALNEARQRGFDGIVCGHIHVPDLDEQDGILYINDGDWVENCTAVVEHHSGRLELLRCHEQVATETEYQWADASRAA